MAIRLVDHSRRTKKMGFASPSYMKPGMIVNFPYQTGEDYYDPEPLVFVLSNFKKEKIVGPAILGQKKIYNQVNGINLRYLKPELVDKLLEEENLLHLKGWSNYKKAFRTYHLTDFNRGYEIKYTTKKEIARERRDKIQEDNIMKNKIKDMKKDASKRKRIERKSK